MKTTFIYALLCPTTGDTKYVGKADYPKKRLASHMRRPCNTGMWKWRNLLKELGLIPLLSILEECSVDIWEERERWWINHFRSMPNHSILNVLDGGNGCSECGSIAREKIRLASVGRKRSPETRAKISESSLGNKHTPETKAKLSLLRLGKKNTQESKERMRQAAIRRHDIQRSMMIAERNSPEYQAKKKNAQSTPEYLEYLEHQSNHSKQMWADPEKRAEIISSMKKRSTPEYLAKQSASQKAAHERKKAAKLALELGSSQTLLHSRQEIQPVIHLV